MTIFAQESFWKTPSFWDLAGFVIGISSIWLAIYLARRDLTQRIDLARREALEDAARTNRQIQLIGIKEQIEEVRHALELCQEAHRGERFERAAEYVLSAENRFVRITARPLFVKIATISNTQFQDDARIVHKALENTIRKTPGRLLRNEIALLQSLVVRMIQLGSDFEREIAGG